MRAVPQRPAQQKWCVLPLAPIPIRKPVIIPNRVNLAKTGVIGRIQEPIAGTNAMMTALAMAVVPATLVWIMEHAILVVVVVVLQALLMTPIVRRQVVS